MRARELIVSSQDFSPAPYPLYAGERHGGTDTLRCRRRARATGIGFTPAVRAHAADHHGGGRRHADRFRPQPALRCGARLRVVPLVLAPSRGPAAGLPFSLTLLAILLAHEFGHYLAALYHRVDASLPYFLPSPLLGTFGAFIKVRSPIYSKRVLFDIGVSGPIAGFVFLLPALSIGLAFSKVIPGIAHQGSCSFGVPGLQRLMERVIFPGTPSADIYLHPVARAAWVGMFTTALNLLPIGQLDGGHILYAFFPAQHRLVSRVVALLLLPLATSRWAWALWAVVCSGWADTIP